MSYFEAINCKHADKWNDAMAEEIDNIIKNDTWILVENPKAPILGLKWIYRIKNDGRFQARLVALGNFQSENSFSETYSSLVRDYHKFLCFSLILKLRLFIT